MCHLGRLCCALAAALVLTIVISSTPVFSSAGRESFSSAAPAGVNAAAAYAIQAAPSPTPASTLIEVNSLADVAANDGLCTLREAITSANTNTASGAASGECAAGGELDAIHFSVTGTIPLTSALPDLATALSLNGPGARLLTVSGNNTTRVFTVSSTAMVYISDLTISGGRATFGGGINNGGGTLTISKCAITGNSATDTGGGVNNNNAGTLNVNNSTISSNSAGPSGGGGGLYNSANAVLINTTVSTNSGGGGGGLQNVGTLTLRYTTVTANSATNSGGGIYNLGIGILNFGNTIIAGNSATSSGPDGSGAQFNSEDYNLIGDTGGFSISGTTTHNITGVSADLGPLADNGGATQTHRPLYTSPAVDKGKSVNAGFGVLNDQRGLARPLDFTEVADAAGGDGSDIGAVELQGDDQPESGRQPFVVNSKADTDDGSCDAAGAGTGNRDCTLREALNAANALAGVDSVNFDPTVFAAPGPHTIQLTAMLPTISTSVTVNGPGPGVLTLRRSAAGFYRLLHITAIPVRLSGMTLTNGRAPNGAGAGGALFNSGVTTLTDVRVTGNRSGDGAMGSPSGGSGGGIYNSGTLTLVNCLVAGNTTGDGVIGSGNGDGGGGGGIYSSGVLTLTNCLVNGNGTGTGPNAGGNGGGVYASNTAMLTNTTVSNNTTGSGGFSPSSSGGGLYANGLTLTLTNSTITGNSSRSTIAHGVAIGPSRASISVGNTIIARNGPGTQSDLTAFSNEYRSRGHNIIGVAYADGAFTDGQNGDRVGSSAAPFDPLLSALGDYGGPTQTFAPLPGSPAIDAGSSAGAPARDQRGVGRVGAVDIGAFESRGFVVTAASGTPQSAVINTAFGAQLSASVGSAFGEPTAGGLVTFSAPASGASGTFNGPTTVNINSDGVATSPVFRANGTAGSYNVTASAGPSSAAFALTNLKAATATALSSSANPSAVGQPVTFTASVTSTFGTPTGSVLFKSDGTDLGTASLNTSGVATLTTSGLSAGAHTLTADYGGDSNFNASGGALAGTQTVGSVVEFAQSAYTVAERGGSLTVNVKRAGDTSTAVDVDYATDDGSVPSVAVLCSDITGIALERCDFTKALGTLHFAVGETEKSFKVLISDDSYSEGAEAVMLRLSNPSAGAVLGGRTGATLNITDDASESASNPIDSDETFVRQHYHDFLGREPDASGLSHWAYTATNCGAADVLVCRINVSAAFFLSIEFQGTGYLVERMYKAAFGDTVGVTRITGSPVQIPVPVIRRSEFLADSKAVANGVVVGQGDWQAQMEANKMAFAQSFVQRARFVNDFGQTTSAAAFADKLFANCGVTPTAAERQAAISAYGSGEVAGRAAALLSVAQSASFDAVEKNRAFVLMQFFGYLQRDPDQAPDADHTGYQFWLDKLNQFNGNFEQAEMVKAFISSDEYRRRFGQ